MKFSVIAFVVVVATGNCIYHSFSYNKQSISSLLLDNVEALAGGEHIGLYVCYGSGSIDCPNGIKVKYYYNNVR